MNKAGYKKTTHPIKSWLVESPWICLPRGTKRYYKKFLSRRERYRNRWMNEEQSA